VAVLPLAAEYQINDRWRLNTDIGYAYVDSDNDEIAYGVAPGFSAALFDGLNRVPAVGEDVLGMNYSQVLCHRHRHLTLTGLLSSNVAGGWHEILTSCPVGNVFESGVQH
jgi:hypothetical protein